MFKHSRYYHVKLATSLKRLVPGSIGAPHVGQEGPTTEKKIIEIKTGTYVLTIF